jgi:hypothetical protein
VGLSRGLSTIDRIRLANAAAAVVAAAAPGDSRIPTMAKVRALDGWSDR